jgi:hypothetical protein
VREGKTLDAVILVVTMVLAVVLFGTLYNFLVLRRRRK